MIPIYMILKYREFRQSNRELINYRQIDLRKPITVLIYENVSYFILTSHYLSLAFVIIS